jgi:cellulose synthase/poly-beta-1,6-N-acetylglucosamine synthase-like glycosyltransferase/peptidoglycan/xylan/chitin deacetylase (PgdA/CDA1 family)
MIFLAQNSKRRLIFRGAIIGFCVILFLAAVLLIYRLTNEYSGRAAIPDAVASEYYHYYYTAVAVKKVALTFDDGPNLSNTLRIAQELKKENVPATFFFIGQNVLEHPDIAKEVSDLGFPIGGHSFTHTYTSGSTFGRLARELNSTSYVIKLTTGQDVRWYRPPYLVDIGGDPMFNPYITNEPSVGWSLDLGYLPVGADIDSLDWQLKKPQDILAHLDTQMGNQGHIALFHDEPATAEALPKIIEKFTSAGYEFVTLDELLIPPSSILLTEDLKLGDTDAATEGQVSQLQWFLYRHGDLDPYAISGYFGDQTSQALRRYQLNADLVDKTDTDPRIYGIAGEKTRAAIAAIPIGLSKNAPLVTPTNLATAGTELLIIWVVAHVREILLFAVAVTFAMVFIRLWLMLCLLGYRKLMSTAHLRFMQKHEGTKGIPYLSVVVPAWNEAENIEATVRSLIVDRGVIKEIIVVDDGSTDATPQIVEDIISKHGDEQVRLIRVENGGKARALNIGMEQAKSGIVMTMDADAIIKEGTLAALARHFIDPSVGAVAGKVYTTSLDTLFDKMQALEYMIGQNIDKPALEVLNGIGVVPGPIGAWRKEVVLAAGGFSTDTLVEDQDMTLAVLSLGKRVIFERAAVAYTETPKNLSSFMKQRFRWVYGTMQCFWKYKRHLLKRPSTGVGLLITLPNIGIFNVYLPLMYPILDLLLFWSLLSGEPSLIILPSLVFTTIDFIYAMWGVRGEPESGRLIPMVLFVRFVYRYLILYTVVRSLVRALEGRGLHWSKVVKIGEAQRLYFSSLAANVVATITAAEAAPVATASEAPATASPTTAS